MYISTFKPRLWSLLHPTTEANILKRMWKLNLTGKEHGVLLQRFADMIGLPSQRAFINLQVITLDQDTISWEKVT